MLGKFGACSVGSCESFFVTHTHENAQKIFESGSKTYDLKLTTNVVNFIVYVNSSYKFS